MKIRHKYLYASITICSLMLYGMGSVAADTIGACIKTNSGNIKIAESATDCNPSEEFVEWAVQGPMGDKGDTGDTGPAVEITVNSEYLVDDLGPADPGEWIEHTLACPVDTLLTGGGCDRYIGDSENYDLIHHRPLSGDVANNTWSCIWQCTDEVACGGTVAAVQAICLSQSPVAP